VPWKKKVSSPIIVSTIQFSSAESKQLIESLRSIISRLEGETKVQEKTIEELKKEVEYKNVRIEELKDLMEEQRDELESVKRSLDKERHKRMALEDGIVDQLVRETDSNINAPSSPSVNSSFDHQFTMLWEIKSKEANLLLDFKQKLLQLQHS